MTDLPDLTDAFERSGLLDVTYTLTDSPVGELLLAATPRGLVRLAYVDGPEAQDEEDVLLKLAQRVSPRVLAAPKRFDGIRRQLDEFFEGRRLDFETPLDWSLAGSGFRLRVLQATAKIPFGETTTYKRLATSAGNEKAYRAAGNAVGSNPLPIVVPCHRVLHSGGGLGGYTGGLDKKRVLLRVEGHETAR